VETFEERKEKHKDGDNEMKDENEVDEGGCGNDEEEDDEQEGGIGEVNTDIKEGSVV